MIHCLFVAFFDDGVWKCSNFGFELQVFVSVCSIFKTGIHNLLLNFTWSKLPFISIEQHKGRDIYRLYSSVPSAQSAKRATDWGALKSGIASATLGIIRLIRTTSFFGQNLKHSWPSRSQEHPCPREAALFHGGGPGLRRWIKFLPFSKSGDSKKVHP
jgi:hypothetical protein